MMNSSPRIERERHEPKRRRLTVRRARSFDPQLQELSIDFFLHDAFGPPVANKKALERGPFLSLVHRRTDAMSASSSA